jgi:hypothetical protein
MRQVECAVLGDCRFHGFLSVRLYPALREGRFRQSVDAMKLLQPDLTAGNLNSLMRFAKKWVAAFFAFRNSRQAETNGKARGRHGRLSQRTAARDNP